MEKEFTHCHIFKIQFFFWRFSLYFNYHNIDLFRVGFSQKQKFKIPEIHSYFLQHILFYVSMFLGDALFPGTNYK